MEWLGITLVLLIVLGLGVRQASYILIKGAIFQWLRDYIKCHAYTGSWVWGKVHELITCNVCMTTQVAIWIAALPTAFVLYFRLPLSTILMVETPLVIELSYSLWVWFLLSMAYGASAMGWWWVLSYLPTKLDAMTATPRKFYAAPELPLEWFRVAVAQIENDCLAIGCAAVRSNTISNSIDRIVQGHVGSGALSPEGGPALRSVLSMAYSYYLDLVARGKLEGKAVRLAYTEFFNYPQDAEAKIPYNHLPLIEVLHVGDDGGPYIWTMGDEADGIGGVGYVDMLDAVNDAKRTITELWPDIFTPARPGLKPIGSMQAIVAVGTVGNYEHVCLTEVRLPVAD